MKPTVIRDTRSSRIALRLFATWLVFAATLPFWAETAWLREFTEMACFFILAMMWNLLAGYGGMVSVGQQAFFGLGGYAMLTLADLLGINPFLAIPMAAACAAVLAVPVSWVAFRLQGGYFAIGTWVIAEVLRLTIANIQSVGGGSGTSLTSLRGIDRATRQNLTFWIALLCVTACIVGVYAFLRSKQGLALQAIRDNPMAAESQGIAVQKMKLSVFVISAMGCGAAGALYFVANLRISPDAAFSVNWTAFAIFIVVIGGIGQLEGPMLGASIYWLLNRFFSDYGTWYQMGLGLMAIVITIWFKRGLWGALSDRFELSFFPTRRTLTWAKPDEPVVTGAPTDSHMKLTH
ncbi:branched-chain amino acid ABC transporter permease [Aquabacterium sp.]|uniref:branched-chain amino acid ABC transporter permease n=1 Tax=Aquabacterium sp. TaxID=1872578 RepID=UPI0025B9DF44|nr:branched-chain amino acid ABC transporter permease [Aquabacterium sp.]